MSRLPTHDLPEGWSLPSIMDIAGKPQYGWTTRARSGPGVKLLRTTDITSGTINWDSVPACEEPPPDLSKYLLRPGDIVVSRAGSVGFSAIIDEFCPAEAVFASYLMRLQPKPALIRGRYLQRFMQSPDYWRQVGTASVGVGLANVNGSKLAAMTVPTPPIDVQDVLIELLDEVESARARAETRLAHAARSVTRFRQAILSAACSGRLTADWRDQHRSDDAPREVENLIRRSRGRAKGTLAPPAVLDMEVPDTWPLVSLDALSTRVTSGSRDWRKYYGHGEGTFVMAQNVRRGKLDWSYRQAVDAPVDDPSTERSRIARGDLLVTIVGANTGDVGPVLDDRQDHFVCQSVALVRPTDQDLTPFLNMWLNSPRHGRRYFEQCIYGAGRPHLSFAHLKSTPVALPSSTERAEIARRITELFAATDAVAERMHATHLHVDRASKAVLSKAFSGELTNT